MYSSSAFEKPSLSEQRTPTSNSLRHGTEPPSA